MHSLLFKYFKRFCFTYNIDGNMARKKYDLLFSRMIEYSPSVSCDINDVTGIIDNVQACSVKTTSITNSFKDIWMNKPPLPTNAFDVVNIPISCINTTDIDDIERSSSYSMKDIATCSTILCVNIHPFCILRGQNLNNKYLSRDCRTSGQLVSPFIMNEHTVRWN